MQNHYQVIINTEVKVQNEVICILMYFLAIFASLQNIKIGGNF